MATDVWTPGILGKVKALLARGLSTAEIGKKIGVSKNAVVGKLNRLGWNAKSAQMPTKKKVAAPAKKPVVVPTKKTVAPTKKPTKSVPQKPAKGKGDTARVPAKKVAPAKGKKAPAPLPGKKSPAPKIAPRATAKALPKTNQKTLAMHQRIIQHSMEMATLRPDQCRWPIGDPDSENFHFCGAPVFVGKPYCYEHCKAAYQFQQMPKKKS